MPQGNQRDRVRRYDAPSKEPTAAVLNAAKIVEFGLNRCGTAKSTERIMTAARHQSIRVSR
jgi:hypothetical protein